MLDRREHIIQRVFAQVKADYSCLLNSHPCLIWQGGTSGKPKPGDRNSRGHSYPRMSLNGGTAAVHIVVFTHFFGYVPRHRQIDHLCKNRLCVQPFHLALASHKENQRRRDGKAPRKNSLPSYTGPVADNLAAELHAIYSQFQCEAA